MGIKIIDLYSMYECLLPSGKEANPTSAFVKKKYEALTIEQIFFFKSVEI